MSTTHVGKIGRLPKSIRDELGRRMEDGEPGKELVKWLNELTGVKKVLEEQFEGRPVTEQNLSEWRQNGHQDWLRQEQTRSLVAKLTEHAENLAEASDGQQISDLFASVLAAELAQLAAALLEKETDTEKRWQRLREVHHELSQLRRDDHRAVRTFIKRERWNREVESEEDEEDLRVQRANKERLIDMVFAPMRNQTIAEAFGGGEYGKRQAELIHRIKFDMPLDDLLDPKPSGETQPVEVKPDQTKSDPIQPNPTNSSNGHPPVANHHDDAT